MKTITLNLEDDEKAVAVPGYESRYVVTSLGRVFSLIRGTWMKGGLTGAGYLQVNLSDGHSKKSLYIHRLVAKTFKIPGWDDPNLEVDHINRDKTDNRLINLRMVTSKQNKANRDREQLSKSYRLSKRNTKFEYNRSKPCVCIESNEFFWSQAEAANAIGHHGRGCAIGMNCRGIKPSVYGLHFRYATSDEIQQHS